jgi:pimeloyl-ACP methyl ester carboxylesterase
VLLRRIAGLGGIKPGMYLGEELAKVDVPTLVLWGEHDMAPLEEGRRESARIARAQFVAMMGLGHHPFLEAPEETARLIREFIASTSTGRAARDPGWGRSRPVATV